MYRTSAFFNLTLWNEVLLFATGWSLKQEIIPESMSPVSM